MTESTTAFFVKHSCDPPERFETMLVKTTKVMGLPSEEGGVVPSGVTGVVGAGLTGVVTKPISG